MRRSPRLSQRTAADYADARSVVIALKPEIAEAITDGLHLKQIWTRMRREGSFPAGYDRFRRLVRRFVSPLKARRAVIAPPAEPRGFVFGRPNKEELV